ncbi:oligoribonuclease [Actinomycetes bacterium]|nr:oligoribonuclease [Actinomycetes bacterium]
MTKDRMVWIDLEMTGLDLGSDEIVEIACIVTEADLTELDEGIDIVVKANPEPLAAMDEFVVNMHKASGLIDEITSGTTLADAQRQVLAYIQVHVPEAGKAQLAGSSVYVDRGFLAKYLPELDSYLHYRLIDVSSIKELTRRWYPRVYFGAPEKTGNHRALADIRESIAELRYYRDAVFVAQPGPDSEVAKALGKSHIVDHAGPAHPNSGTGSVG